MNRNTVLTAEGLTEDQYLDSLYNTSVECTSCGEMARPEDMHECTFCGDYVCPACLKIDEHRELCPSCFEAWMPIGEGGVE